MIMQCTYNYKVWEGPKRNFDGRRKRTLTVVLFYIWFFFYSFRRHNIENWNTYLNLYINLFWNNFEKIFLKESETLFRKLSNKIYFLAPWKLQSKHVIMQTMHDNSFVKTNTSDLNRSIDKICECVLGRRDWANTNACLGYT